MNRMRPCYWLLAILLMSPVLWAAELRTEHTYALAADETRPEASLEDGVAFYELLLLVVEDGTLSLKVKHFNADFSAWEEKPDFVNFRLVKKEKDALHFQGLSFYKRGDDAIDGYIVMKNGDMLTEHRLTYGRQQ
ncbi:MAG: hypothetical protein KJN77_01205 [Gammaproteobacteria bacterium]|nr:hypothetical protein [Gammaproteobacteria bacterium]